MKRYDITIEDERVFLYHGLKENQLFRINEPDEGVFIAESPAVIERAISAGYEPVSFLIEKEQMTPDIVKMTEPFDVPVYICSYEELKTLVGYHMTRGVLCAFNRRPNPDIRQVCRGRRRVAVLENIMNPTNTGAIIRSAAALGVEAVLLTKGCADPLQRRASRVSMGNIFSIPWAYMDTYLVDMDLLKEMGFSTVSMALAEEAVYINNIVIDRNDPLAVILGTEGEGLSPETIAKSDVVVQIPMTNGVDSLNVAAASAVAFWEICR